MNVALVYNQKKEDTSQPSGTNDATEPPSFEGTIFNPLDSHAAQTDAIQNVSDLYAEWDTPETIAAVQKSLEELHDVTLIEADEFAFERLREQRPEIVFNITEGLHGVSREAQIPAILEMLRIPYTGSDPLTLAICLDKSRAKEIMAYYHLPTPRFLVVYDLSLIKEMTMPFPVMVKPLHEGSSKGIYNSSVVRSKSDLQREIERIFNLYHEPALVEEYLTGREFTVALMGNGEIVTALPIVEIKFDSLPAGVNPIYSYEAKWIWDRTDAPLDIFECPAKISPSLQTEIEMICKQAFRILRCRDWCRVDIRLDATGRPHILELNPLPGILPNPEDNSCFPKAARAAGLTYNQLIQGVLALAAKRSGLLNQEPAILQKS
jgi:D-alanine-D-alanine ligase